MERAQCIAKNGLTVTEAARILCVDRQTPGNLLNVRSGLSPEMAVRLGKAFGTFARGHGKPVADQPSAQAHQDLCPRRAPRPHHHLPAGRGRRHWPNGARHPRYDPPPSIPADICMTLKLSRCERIRQGRSVRRAEKRDPQGSVTYHARRIVPEGGVPVYPGIVRGRKRWADASGLATFAPTGAARGEYG